MEWQTILWILVILVLLYVIFSYITKERDMLNAQITAGNVMTMINPSSSGANNMNSSNFTYSVWFYINDWNYRYGEPKVIFGRMGGSSDASGGSVEGISGIDPCPAVVLGAIENNLMVSLGCYPGADIQPTTTGGKTVVHRCGVSNIPIQKWVNLIISVYGRTMDLYIDGKLVRTCLLPGVASVNNNANIFVTPKGGFDGWTSKLEYYPNSLNPQDCWNIYSKGYGGGFSLFGAYDVQISILENGTTTNSVTF